MNSRWFLVQVTTSKRVIMENEREKELREELKKIQDSKPRGDSLLKLIKGLQRLQASGPHARGVKSPLLEQLEVARLVAKYHGRIVASSPKATGPTPCTEIACGTERLEAVKHYEVVRCRLCLSTRPRQMFVCPCGGQGCDDVFILRPVRQ